MNNISLNLKEQKILWSVLNQAQHIGLSDIAQKIKSMTEGLNDNAKLVLDNWISQTTEEYDLINVLKVKLCGDLE